MGTQEKDIIELFREMMAERRGANVTSEGLATLTMARILKRTLEKCCIEICGVLEQSQPMTTSQARAILEMDRIACDGGHEPKNNSEIIAWDAMVEQAKNLTNEGTPWR